MECGLDLDIREYLTDFVFADAADIFDVGSKTKQEYIFVHNHKIPKYINEFWTAKQRQANSLHEISYRACFEPPVFLNGTP